MKKNFALYEMQCNGILRKLENYKNEENYERVKKFFTTEKENILNKTLSNEGKTVINGVSKMSPKQFMFMIQNWCETEDEVKKVKANLEMSEAVARARKN